MVLGFDSVDCGCVGLVVRCPVFEYVWYWFVVVAVLFGDFVAGFVAGFEFCGEFACWWVGVILGFGVVCDGFGF